jgi:hypothetical protein
MVAETVRDEWGLMWGIEKSAYAMQLKLSAASQRALSPHHNERRPLDMSISETAEPAVSLVYCSTTTRTSSAKISTQIFTMFVEKADFDVVFY